MVVAPVPVVVPRQKEVHAFIAYRRDVVARRVLLPHDREELHEHRVQQLLGYRVELTDAQLEHLEDQFFDLLRRPRWFLIDVRSLVDARCFVGTVLSLIFSLSLRQSVLSPNGIIRDHNSSCQNNIFDVVF